MFCSKCGSQMADGVRFCKNCGSSIDSLAQASTESTVPQYQNQGQAQPFIQTQPPVYPSASMGGGIGFSPRINDPAFAKYTKNSNKFAMVFSLIMAVVAVVGFTIYGQSSSEMGNPQAFFIGCGIGGMFIVIAVFQVMGKKSSKTWDGQVVDKRIEQKKRQQNNGDDTSYTEKYTEFTVFIRSNEGKDHKIRVENDATIYNYYTIGDHVRHHGVSNTYEKYDKSQDTIIFCNACASLCDIHDDYCKRCKCPLLKS